MSWASSESAADTLGLGSASAGAGNDSTAVSVTGASPPGPPLASAVGPPSVGRRCPGGSGDTIVGTLPSKTRVVAGAFTCGSALIRWHRAVAVGRRPRTRWRRDLGPRAEPAYECRSGHRPGGARD